MNKKDRSDLALMPSVPTAQNKKPKSGSLATYVYELGKRVEALEQKNLVDRVIIKALDDAPDKPKEVK